MAFVQWATSGEYLSHLRPVPDKPRVRNMRDVEPEGPVQVGFSPNICGARSIQECRSLALPSKIGGACSEELLERTPPR